MCLHFTSHCAKRRHINGGSSVCYTTCGKFATEKLQLSLFSLKLPTVQFNIFKKGHYICSAYGSNHVFGIYQLVILTLTFQHFIFQIKKTNDIDFNISPITS
jgi:hypothetical protein